MKASTRAKLVDKLRRQLDGEVRSDEATLERYSTDNSIYQLKPLLVVWPDSMEDLEKIILLAGNENLPITPRGGGSGTAGSALGRGMVLRFRQDGFLGKIKGMSCSGGQCRVVAEVGVSHQRLQDYLIRRGYYLPADPSSGPLCQLGGNIATKASGPHGLSHGAIDNFIEQLEFFTAQGNYINTQVPSSIPRELSCAITSLLKAISNDPPSLELLRARAAMKTASGYNLKALLQECSPGTRLARLLVGSVGTLGVFTRATLRVEAHTPEKSALLLCFRSLAELAEAVALAREHQPTAMELISRQTISIIQSRTGRDLGLPDSGHLLFIEFEGAHRQEQLETVATLLKGQGFDFTAPARQAGDEQELQALWKVRKQILPILMHPGPALRALSLVNDVGVDPIYLAPFIADLEQLFARLQLETILFGHAGNGNLHLRPLIDLSRPDLKEHLQAIADQVYGLVFRYQGTITAEHGMGRLRAPYLQQEWGAAIYQQMQTLKEIFDPRDLLNPGVMFSQEPITSHLRSELTGARPKPGQQQGVPHG
ncbi:FAD-binding oxidoreductase [Desulfogranum mediterraneum]|uniref:FAD-binding oxidoreductase n=1 Tax=Desulfogranum mediterraneum TaxID=160661 RepID=UPI000407432D|nr:FAD-binding oxidoreductase [Desulfogranum mediterraneum]